MGNAAGQLATASKGSTEVGTYVYDYLSRLTQRDIVPPLTTVPKPTSLRYLHDLDGNIIAEYDASGQLLT